MRREVLSIPGAANGRLGAAGALRWTAIIVAVFRGGVLRRGVVLDLYWQREIAANVSN